MCPRSVALPRFSRTTHTARAAKRSNFSYSQRCTTGHRPTASRYNNHHHRCRASAAASSVSSSIKVINQTTLITISTLPPQRPSQLCRHATRCQVLPKNIGSAANRFSKELVTYSPNHALFPIRLSKKFAGTKHVRPAATLHPASRCCRSKTRLVFQEIDALTTVRLCKSPNSSTTCSCRGKKVKPTVG